MATPTLKLNTNTQNITFGQYAPQQYKPLGDDMSILERGIVRNEERRDKMAEYQNKLDTTMATLESKLHNDKETRAWFASYKANIDKKIKDQADAGNYALAYREAIEQAGKVLVDPAMQGRIQAEADFQEERKLQQQRRERGEISDTTYDWWEAENQYSYSDVYNDDGEIVGGSGWHTKSRPVKDLDVSKMSFDMFKMISPEKEKHKTTTHSTGAHANRKYAEKHDDDTDGIDEKAQAQQANNQQGNQQTNQQANNQQGNNYNPDIPEDAKVVQTYATDWENSYEQVEWEHINENIVEFFNMYPDYRESAHQKYNVDVWKLKQMQAERDAMKAQLDADPYNQELKDKYEALNDQTRDRERVLTKNGSTLMNYEEYASRYIYNNLIAKNMAYRWVTTAWGENIGDNYYAGRGGNGSGSNAKGRIDDPNYKAKGSDSEQTESPVVTETSTEYKPGAVTAKNSNNNAVSNIITQANQFQN